MRSECNAPNGLIVCRRFLNVVDSSRQLGDLRLNVHHHCGKMIIGMIIGALERAEKDACEYGVGTGVAGAQMIERSLAVSGTIHFINTPRLLISTDQPAMKVDRTGPVAFHEWIVPASIENYHRDPRAFLLNLIDQIVGLAQ